MKKTKKVIHYSPKKKVSSPKHVFSLRYWLHVIGLMSLMAAVLGVMAYQQHTAVLGAKTMFPTPTPGVKTPQQVAITVTFDGVPYQPGTQVWEDDHTGNAKPITLSLIHGKLIGTFSPKKALKYTFSAQSPHPDQAIIFAIASCGRQTVVGNPGDNFVSLNLDPASTKNCTVTFQHKKKTPVAPTPKMTIIPHPKISITPQVTPTVSPRPWWSFGK